MKIEPKFLKIKQPDGEYRYINKDYIIDIIPMSKGSWNIRYDDNTASNSILARMTEEDLDEELL